MNFEGKVAMITGAGVGIGRACAIRFGELGAKLVLLDYNAVRFTWQEIRHQKFRLTVYALSLLLFLYHLLAALGVVSIQSLLPEQVRFEVNFLLNLAFAPLLLVTIYFAVRDTWRHMYDRPL